MKKLIILSLVVLIGNSMDVAAGPSSLSPEQKQSLVEMGNSIRKQGILLETRKKALEAKLPKAKKDEIEAEQQKIMQDKQNGILNKVLGEKKIGYNLKKDYTIEKAAEECKKNRISPCTKYAEYKKIRDEIDSLLEDTIESEMENIQLELQEEMQKKYPNEYSAYLELILISGQIDQAAGTLKEINEILSK